PAADAWHRTWRLGVRCLRGHSSLPCGALSPLRDGFHRFRPFWTEAETALLRFSAVGPSGRSIGGNDAEERLWHLRPFRVRRGGATPRCAHATRVLRHYNGERRDPVSPE